MAANRKFYIISFSTPRVMDTVYGPYQSHEAAEQEARTYGHADWHHFEVATKTEARGWFPHHWKRSGDFQHELIH